ncbi:hAT family dimerization protein [Ceratobasidium sp. AG-Ba]|nr:hAT family dimerization protein [Ceratobasidium sp. AG-Ba]
MRSASICWPYRPSQQVTPLPEMELANLTTAPPLHPAVPPPYPGIKPADLYHLSDHEARVYPLELVAAAALSVWTSPVYDHFHVGCRSVSAPDPITGVPTFRHLEYTFTCKHDPEHCRMKTRKRKATASYGTKNLKEAVQRCNGRRGVTEAPQEAPVPFSQSRFRAYLLVCPLSASFLGIVAIWREGATIWRTVLDFIHLTESHSGQYLADRTIECLTRYRVINQIETICLDNASNNNTLVRSLEPHLPSFYGPASRTNCSAHVVNLVARAFMSPCNRPKAKRRRTAGSGRLGGPRGRPTEQLSSPSGSLATEQTDELPSTSEDPEVVVDEIDGMLQPPVEVDEGKEQHDAEVVQESVLEAMNTMRTKYGLLITDAQTEEARSLYTKVNGFVAHLHKSTTDYVAFAEIRKRCQDSIHSNFEIPSAVNTTRWNSELRCSESYLALRTPIEVMLTDTRYRSLWKYRLTTSQWELLELMRECLQVFNEVTLLFSQKDANIHEVFPVFNTLRFRLRLMRDDTDNVLHPALRIGAQAALNTLEKYVKIMEGSEIYWMATALCPWYKFSWFIENGYDPSLLPRISGWIERRVAKIAPAANNSSQASTSGGPALAPISRWMSRPPQASPASHSNSQAAGSVAAYLSAPVVNKQAVDRMGGILNYWVREQDRGSLLARVALNILTAPPSSVDAERAFSVGRMAVNYRQHRMSLSTFRAKMALGSWYGTPLLSDIDEVEDILNDSEGSEPSPLNL